MIMDAIASHLVLPNRLTIPLVADLHVAQLRSPLPRVTVSLMNDLEKHWPAQTEAAASKRMKVTGLYSLFTIWRKMDHASVLFD